MLTITDAGTLARALDSPLDDALRALLRERVDQLLTDTDHEYDLSELAKIIIVDPGDSVLILEATAGCPLVTSPAFEWVADHGGWFEAITVLSDDGFGIILFVPNRADVDHALLGLLRQFADRARPDSLSVVQQEGQGAPLRL